MEYSRQCTVKSAHIESDIVGFDPVFRIHMGKLFV